MAKKTQQPDKPELPAIVLSKERHKDPENAVFTLMEWITKCAGEDRFALFLMYQQTYWSLTDDGYAVWFGIEFAATAARMRWKDWLETGVIPKAPFKMHFGVEFTAPDAAPLPALPAADTLAESLVPHSQAKESGMNINLIMEATIESIPDLKTIVDCGERIVARYSPTLNAVEASGAFAASSHYRAMVDYGNRLPDGELNDAEMDQAVALGLFRNRPARPIDPATGQPIPVFDGHRIKDLIANLPGIVGNLPQIVSNIQAGYEAIKPLLTLFGITFGASGASASEAK